MAGSKAFPHHGANLDEIVEREDPEAHLPSDQDSSESHDERCRMWTVEGRCFGVEVEGVLLY
jgi:hypothetical protein